MTDPRIEAAARALNTEGWTCQEGSDEPGNYGECEDCTRACDDLARAALDAADNAATITTTEELEHLEFGTVVRDTCGDIAEKWSPVNAIRLWYSPGKLDGKANEAIALPARVIHWGTE